MPCSYTGWLGWITLYRSQKHFQIRAARISFRFSNPHSVCQRFMFKMNWAQSDIRKIGICLSPTGIFVSGIGRLNLNLWVSLCTSRSGFRSSHRPRAPILDSAAWGTSAITDFAVRIATAHGTSLGTNEFWGHKEFDVVYLSTTYKLIFYPLQ